MLRPFDHYSCKGCLAGGGKKGRLIIITAGDFSDYLQLLFDLGGFFPGGKEGVQIDNISPVVLLLQVMAGIAAGQGYAGADFTGQG